MTTPDRPAGCQLAGPLTLTLTGPRFSANDRLHWRAAQPLKKAWRDLGHVHARAAVGASFRPIERAYVVATLVPGSRRRVDPANTGPAVKACVDGIVAAGVLVEDDAAHLVGPDYRLAPEPVRQQPGMWTLRITITPLVPALNATETTDRTALGIPGPLDRQGPSQPREGDPR